jgi:hypothetical protein
MTWLLLGLLACTVLSVCVYVVVITYLCREVKKPTKQPPAEGEGRDE